MDNLEPRSVYQSLLSDYSVRATSLRQRLKIMSLVRILLFASAIFLTYKAIIGDGYFFGIAAAFFFITFFIFLQLYDRLEQKLAFYDALSKLNNLEIDFLNGGPLANDQGKEYTDPHHPYSYDLDIFGEGGLFPYLNRTSTHFGKEALAQSLLHPDSTAILERQQAISELTAKLEFRQHLQAYGMIQEIREKEMKQLKNWLRADLSFPNKSVYFFLWIFPLATLSCLLYYIFSENEAILGLFSTLFVVNLVITGLLSPKIKTHLNASSAVNKVLQQFSKQLTLIEAETFRCSLLQAQQANLKTGGMPASASIARLSRLFDYIDMAINLVVSPILNGFFLFHTHILFRIDKWKHSHGDSVINWLELLGRIESLNSFSNFAYNNPSFSMPVLKNTECLATIEMGHPLIPEHKRINNSISFDQQPFVILTGSNMSGKSTFLRTLGINLVLARAGSMVCAKEFVFYPYSIEVSMRISDSLQDSESFFYAELKRLQHIIRELEEGNKLFVILDEILRGTNSNDKHNGTVGLIRKLVAANACGIIATHDLTVSKLADEYPSHISNKCFESQIVHDELVFNYKLGDGVCTTLSASFLMKKMGVI